MCMPGLLCYKRCPRSKRLRKRCKSTRRRLQTPRAPDQLLRGPRSGSSLFDQVPFESQQRASLVEDPSDARGSRTGEQSDALAGPVLSSYNTLWPSPKGTNGETGTGDAGQVLQGQQSRVKSSVHSNANGGVPKSLDSSCITSQLAKFKLSSRNARHLSSTKL